MGEKKKRLVRAVLDTNVFISAVLFKGRIASLVEAWKAKQFIFPVSKELLEEYTRVLSYPKFKLTEPEIYAILHSHLLPYVTPVQVKKKVEVPLPRDKEDWPVLHCFLASGADYLVTGDRDLLEYPFPRSLDKGKESIITAKEFLEILETQVAEA